LGTIGSNLKKLIRSGLTSKKITELAPSVNLTDLEIIFETLVTVPEKIHYLARRREIEDYLGFEGDELDLLAFYLENGLNFDDNKVINHINMDLTLKSKELHPYFNFKENDPSKKPMLAQNQWWKDILKNLENLKPDNWLEISYLLLSLPVWEQD